MEKLIAMLATAWRKADAEAWKSIADGDAFRRGMKHGIAVGITAATDIVRSYARQQNIAELEYAFGPLESWMPEAHRDALHGAMAQAIDRLELHHPDGGYTTLA